MLNITTTLYPEQQFTSSEMVDIAEALNRPSVKKYLIQLGVRGLKAIAEGQPAIAKIDIEAESAESFLRRQAVVQGQLAVIQTLLTIEAPAKQA